MNKSNKQNSNQGGYYIKWIFYFIAAYCLVILFHWYATGGHNRINPMFTWDYWGKEQVENLRNWALVIAGPIGIGFAFWRSKIADGQYKTALKQLEFTAKQSEATKQQLEFTAKQSVATERQLGYVDAGQKADRFQKGASMLESEKETVRHAGIMVLRDLAKQDLENYYATVPELLCLFLQSRTREQWQALDIREKDWRRRFEVNIFSRIQPDCQAAITAISHIHEKKVEAVLAEGGKLEDIPSLSLNKVNLIGAVLDGAHLERADLSGAHLEEARLSDARLEGADLSFAHLEVANLNFACLEGADLSCAHLEGAYLNHAHLEGAYLSRARLEGANLSKSIFCDEELGCARDITQEQIDSARTWKGYPPIFAAGEHHLDLKPPPTR